MSRDIGARAVISGGTSFIGRELSKFLLDHGCQVICLGDPLKLSPKNVRELARREGFSFERQEPFSPRLLKKVTEKFSRADYVFHLDAYHLAKTKQKFLKSELENFIKGVENLLKLAVYYRARFLLCLPLDFFEKSHQIKNLDDHFDKKDSLSISSFGEAQEVAENLTSVCFQQEKLNSRVVRLGEVFGPGMRLDQKGEATKIIKEVVSGGPIKIPGDGGQVIFPLFVEDAVAGIARAMFAPTTCGEIFALFGEKISLLEFAKIARENFSPRAEIEFVAKKDEKDFSELQAKVPSGWRPKASISEALEKTITFFPEKQKPLPQKKEAPKEEARKRVKRKTSFRKAFLTFALFCLLALFSPFAFLGVNLWTSYNNLVKAAAAAQETHFEEVLRRSQAASVALSRSRRMISLSAPVFKLAGFGDSLSQVEKSIFFGQMIAQTSVEGSLLAQEVNSFFRKVILGEKIDLDSSLSQIKLSLQTFLDKASLTQSLLEQFSGQEVLFGSKVVILREKLPLVRQMGEQARQMVDVTPEILGADQRCTYLILFQNNMEIRPTGGFIGSFGLITFEKGRLLDFEIQDVYSADGQLRGHVEPPPKLSQFLGLSGWYLRDSNWDPNFPTSATQAEWFLEKEIGRSVDGVIAVDLFTLEKILEGAGEIWLPDYDEKVNANNFFERAQYHIEAGFFPGSTGKKDYLGSVANALFEKIKASGQETTAKIATSLYSSLEEKDILIYLHFPRAARTVSQLGWDGAIREVDCAKVWPEECFSDFLMLVEANVGINKANFWVKREIEHKITIDDEGRVSKRLIIDYENKSPNDIFPAGRYKNYLRVLAPQGSVLEKVKITGGEEEKEPEFDEQDEHGKTVFGFLVEVPVGEKRRVEVGFLLPEDQAVWQGNYLFLWQKQPGSFPDTISLSLSLPDNLSLISSSPSLALTGDRILFYNNTLSKDQIFQIKLARK